MLKLVLKFRLLTTFSNQKVPEVLAKVIPEQPVPVKSDGRVKSSPAARRLARELGLDFQMATGSGPGGRIIERDIEALAGSKPAEKPQSASSPNYFQSKSFSQKTR